MTDKITLNSISPTSSVTTAASVINANNAVITAAFDNTFSLDGTIPNQLQNNLDMNSFQILNLPAPVGANSPARLVDIVSNPTLVLTIPAVGTSGAVVGLLNTNMTFSGNNTFSGTNTFSGVSTFNNNVNISAGTPLTLVATNPGAGETGLQIHDATMASTNQLLLILGRSESTNNRAQLGFYYSGLGSANNHGWLGMYAADHAINWDGNTFVGINTSNNVLTKRFQVNSATNFSVDDSGNTIAAGNVTVLGTAHHFGPGGTSSTNNVFAFEGTNSAQGGSVISYKKNNVVQWYVGDHSAITGSSVTDYIIWNNVGGVTQAFSIDQPTSTITVGNGLLSTGTTQGIGYATGSGAGGTVTQATNKGTGVALNTICGQITTNNAALSSSSSVSFTLSNSTIAATDVLILNHVSGGTFGAYGLNAQCASGSAKIAITNNTGGSLSEAIVIQYVLIKGTNN